jgi:hypothetical protein
MDQYYKHKYDFLFQNLMLTKCKLVLKVIKNIYVL